MTSQETQYFFNRFKYAHGCIGDQLLYIVSGKIVKKEHVPEGMKEMLAPDYTEWTNTIQRK